MCKRAQLILYRTGLKSPFVARPTSWERGEEEEQKYRRVYLLRYIQAFFVKGGDGAAPQIAGRSRRYFLDLFSLLSFRIILF
jgi:hypothetical protein